MEKMIRRMLRYSVLPEQEGLSVETILKQFLDLKPREIRHAKYIPNGILKNGISCRTNAAVFAGDEICFCYDDGINPPSDPLLQVSPEKLPPVHIFYEDRDLCVVDKPSGLVCHASHGHFSDSLAYAAAASLNIQTDPSELRCIGRLDKDTSGLVLFAKNRLAAARLSRERESGELKKEYLALVHHPFPKVERYGDIRLSMEQIPEQDPQSCDKSGKRITKMRICPAGEGLHAVTHYEVILQDASWAVVRCHLETGRTHQIRLHMASIGHPLFGDPLYGICDGGFRAALHAWKLQFVHPFTGEHICLRSFHAHMFDS